VKKAISPVIATVIIVAVTIAIAIAVALWMSGLVGSFTATENIQIISAYAEQTTIDTDKDGWAITLQVKNVGTTDATIDNIFINGKPYTSYTDAGNQILITIYTSNTNNEENKITESLSIPLNAGKDATIIIVIPKDAGFASGQMVEVKLHTASAKEYPKQVTLP